MSAPSFDDNLNLESRLSLLRSIASLETLGTDVLTEIASNLVVERFPMDSVILREDTFGDRLYLIQSGVVGVYTDGATGLVQLGKLGAGDRFGAVSLHTSIRRKRTTMKALTPVVALTLTAESYDHLTTMSPTFRAELACALDSFMEGRFGALMQARAMMTPPVDGRPADA
ncbi:MAG: cyclic nucleotide-binding domain-containing protein [Verrucomicrobiota bacterium]